MKKIFAVIMAVAVLSTLGIVIYAETGAELVDPLPEPSKGAEGKIDAFLTAVGSGAFWTTTVSILATLAGCIALFKNRFTQITNSIGKTATAEHLTKQTGTLAMEIKKALGEKTDKISGDISAMMENYRLMLTCFTIFIESAKINANAKKEILDRLTGVKSVSDNVSETVTEALKAIEEANAAEPPVETPKTDAALEMTTVADSTMLLD